MRIGVLCSGGDAPGMNPCLRAIVRAGAKHKDEIVGIRHGYRGLLEEEFWQGQGQSESSDAIPLIGVREVSGLTNRGGSFLNSSRCLEFQTAEGRQKAVSILRKHKFDALITIGGNGTLSGARDLGRLWEGQIVGLPGTIDNDLLGTDYTIGFGTAVHTGVDAIDKLRDTAGSHDMMFLVEVMGRHCGDLAAYVALAGGCELVATPETVTDIPAIVTSLRQFRERGKRSIIMVVAEGDEFGGAETIMKALKEAGSPFEMRTVVLGHVMRGGVPAPFDRILATRLGCHAIDVLHNGGTGVMAGVVKGRLSVAPLDEAVKPKTAETGSEEALKSEAATITRLIDRLSV